MDDSRNQPELETLSYKPANIVGSDADGANPESASTPLELEKLEILNWKLKCDCADCNTPASAPPTTLGFNSHVIKPETRVNKIKRAEEIPEQPIEFPEMDENTKLIINACKQVVRSADDYDNDVMTTPITVVQACEQLNCVLEVIKANKPEQPNQNLMIITEIEGLMSQVNKELESLDVGHYQCVKAVKRGLALEEIDLFQKTTLFELRKANE